MQDQFPEGPDGPETTPRSSVVTPSFGSQPSHRSASDRNLEISPRHSDTLPPSQPEISDHGSTLDNQGAPGSSPMSVSPLLSNNPQMQSNQQMPATSHTPHTILPPYPPTGPPLPSDIAPPRDDQETEVIIAVLGVTGTTHKYSRSAVH